MQQQKTAADEKGHSATRMRRMTYLLLGHLLLTIGAIGVVLPVLPTTIFWVGAAFFYAKSSPKLYRKLTSHKRFGEAIELFVNHGVMSKKSNAAALLGMTFSALLMLLSPLPMTAKLWSLAGLATAALYVMARPASKTGSDPF